MTRERKATVATRGHNAAGQNNQPRRVMHLSATNFFGGPERQIIGHATAVNRGRFQVIVAAFSESGEETELVRQAKAQGLAAETIPVRGAYDLRAPRRIARLIEQYNIDILVTHNYRSNLLGRRAARARKIKHLAVSRGWTHENIKVRFYHWLDKITLARSDLVICVSRSKKDELQAAGVHESRLSVIANAVNIPEAPPQPTVDWRSKHGWDPSTPLVISAGRLSKEKGPDIFLAAVPIILQAVPQVRFILYGDGPMRTELSRKIEQTNLASLVRLAGHVADLPRELSAFDMLVNSSRSEGMPNIILEAMAARLPVVATDVGGVGEIITDGETGRLVRPLDPEALAGAVCDMLADKERAAQLAEQALKTVREKFSFDAQARLYENVYDRLMTGGKPPA